MHVVTPARRLLWLALLISLTWLVACGPGDPTATPTRSLTRPARYAGMPTKVARLEPSSTPTPTRTRRPPRTPIPIVAHTPTRAETPLKKQAATPTVALAAPAGGANHPPPT